MITVFGFKRSKNLLCRNLRKTLSAVKRHGRKERMEERGGKRMKEREVQTRNEREGAKIEEREGKRMK